MSRIGFVGLGNMGLPMAANLVRAGHEVRAHDRDPAARRRAAEAGCVPADDLAAIADGADAVFTMLPAGPQVEAVCLGEDGLIRRLAPGSLLVDCSTIDVATARAVAKAAAGGGLDMLDAPVSGGVAGAAAGTLTFMVGGEEAAFARARPLLEAMGRTIVHAGPSGNGQVAKTCNNMMLGIQMISVCEAMVLAKKLGLSPEKLFEISSKATGQCWSLTSYCPEPGLVESAPSNRGYAPGFATAMMLKDLKLAQQAAQSVAASTPLGAEAYQLYSLFAQGENEGLDFSAIINMIGGTTA